MWGDGAGVDGGVVATQGQGLVLWRMCNGLPRSYLHSRQFTRVLLIGWRHVECRFLRDRFGLGRRCVSRVVDGFVPSSVVVGG